MACIFINETTSGSIYMLQFLKWANWWVASYCVTPNVSKPTKWKWFFRIRQITQILYYLVFFLRHTHGVSSTLSVENVFSSQNITCLQNASSFSTYPRAYSIRCSMLRSLSFGLRAGTRPCRPLSYSLFLTVCEVHWRLCSATKDIVEVKGRRTKAAHMASSCSCVVHRGRPVLSLSDVVPVSANLFIN